MNHEVIVKVLNEVTGAELEEIIDLQLRLGFSIQNSQIELFCGRINGVYVFIRTWSEEKLY